MGRHDREVHKKANELIDSGYGKIALARGLGIRLGDAGAQKSAAVQVIGAYA